VSDDRLDGYLTQINVLLDAKGLSHFNHTNLHGELNQLKALVDLCHAYGIAVIFDLVYNHAGGSFGLESLWFYDRQIGAVIPQYRSPGDRVPPY